MYMVSTICECMELSNQFLDPPTLLALVDTLFANNMAKSYNLAYKLHRIVSEDAKNSMADFVGSWSLLVFPTMFEDESWLLNGFLSVVDAASAKKLATLRYEHLNKLHQQRKEDREKVTSKQDSSPKVSPMDKSPKKKNLDSPTESVSSPAKNTAVDAQSKRKAAIVDSLSLVRSGNSILSLEL